LSRPVNDHGGNQQSSSDGAYTLAEILSQPLCWNTSLKQLRESGVIEEVAKQFAGADEWVFVGCGSSFYVAQAAAATMAALSGKRARALPASELLLYPEIAMAGSGRYAPVLISRSGKTSEVLKVAEGLKTRGIKTLGISCAPGQTLEGLVTHAIVLPTADEQSMVMTRSFSTMLLALQALAAVVAGKPEFVTALPQLVAPAEKLCSSLPARVREFVVGHEFKDYVCLAQGPLFGIASEIALKLTEMSVSYGQVFHTLEFRHGPKSIVSEDTLIVFLLSESGYQSELEVLEEIKKLGGATMVIANHADGRARAAADMLVEIGADGPELARIALFPMTGQLLGMYTGLHKGHDPDRPRNLSRVVILEEETSEHAAI
jgi:glucosamine--fructose-6-phosphate aminotransferase (isomerizing)